MELSEAARELLLEVSQDPAGLILKLTAIGGSAFLKTNSRNFGSGTSSDQARWESALQELLHFGLIEPGGDRGRVFSITQGGSQVAEGLRTDSTSGRDAAVVKVPTATILVVDDNPGVVKLLAVALREEGHRVSSAQTGDEGVRLFTVSRPDVVLLDMALPGSLSGIEVLERLRSINPTARVIMLTANADPQRARAALELGAVAYVDKPFDLAYLKRVVAMALQPGPPQPS